MDPETLDKRRKFTISCDKTSGVVIKDLNDKKGGNFRGKGDKTLSWENNTDESVCYLRFVRIPDEDTDATDAPSWPFKDVPPPDLLLAVPQEGWTTRTLMEVKDTAAFEYVVLGEDGQPLLDPVIIIDPN